MTSSSNDKSYQYDLVVHIHEKRKLFHVACHQITSRKGHRELPTVIAKAKYAVGRLLGQTPIEQNINDYRTSDRIMTGGFMMALWNTNYTGWHTEPLNGIYSKTEADNLKEEEVHRRTELGYVNVGVRKTSTVLERNINGGTPATWNKDFPKSLTKEKIDEKIGYIERSMSEPVSNIAKYNAYMDMVRSPTKKSKYGFEIRNMITLMYFIRIEMKLESPPVVETLEVAA